MHKQLHVNLGIELRRETRLSNLEFKTIDVPGLAGGLANGLVELVTEPNNVHSSRLSFIY
jgi:hypothetical protein